MSDNTYIAVRDVHDIIGCMAPFYEKGKKIFFAERDISRVPYTFYVKRDGTIYFLVNRDLFFLFVIRD